MTTAARQRITGRGVATAVVAGLLLVGTACGGDDDDGAGSATDGSVAENDAARTEATTTTVGGDAGGPLTAETVADACDAFTGVITELRGEAPESVDPNPVTDVNVNGETYRSAECRYLYAGDELADPNRLSILVNHADGMTPGQREQMWDTLAVTEPVTGVGDEGHWHYSATLDVSASARALVGETVVTVRTKVPDDLEGSPWIAKDPMVAALQEILTIMAG